MKQLLNFDETDQKIIDLLRHDGRATNQQIAEKLGLIATTVSSRIKRLEEANQMRVIAVSDFSAHGFDILMRIAIEVDGRPSLEVAEEIAEFPEVVALHQVTGRYDIDLLVALEDLDALSDLMFEQLGKVEGIRRMTPTVVVDVIKYHFDVAPIEAKA